MACEGEREQARPLEDRGTTCGEGTDRVAAWTGPREPGVLSRVHVSPHGAVVPLYIAVGCGLY